MQQIKVKSSTIGYEADWVKINWLNGPNKGLVASNSLVVKNIFYRDKGLLIEIKSTEFKKSFYQN